MTAYRPLALTLLLTTSLPAAAAAKAAVPVSKTAAPVQWKHGWAEGAVFYEVFVRSFLDSNGDGKGDLPGLIAKLDYLNDGNPRTDSDLGVDALWLMPVFEAGSYHGYDVSDYEKISSEYGTNQDFQRLCREAHKRGMRVIIDLVINHTSAGHPWFRESSRSPDSPKRDWYVWRNEDPGWTQPWSNDPAWHPSGDAFYYGVFWRGMPDLNFRNAAVRAEVKRIAKLWLELGADGFRLDAAKYLIEGPDGEQSDRPETHAFWKEFSAYVRSLRPDAVLVGEVWSSIDTIAPYYGDTSVVAGGDELPMNFDFGIGGSIIAAVRDGRASEVFSTLRTAQRVLPRGIIDATFLTNHDQARIGTELDGNPAKLRAAASILLTLPGAPFIYYGEEVGLRNFGDGFGNRGGPGKGDEDKRTPMHWDGTKNGGFTTGDPWLALSGGLDTVNVAAQTRDPSSILSRYRELIALRHRSAALRKGELELVRPQGGVLAYLAKTTGETVLVVHNVGATAATAGPLQLPAGKPVALFADIGVGVPAPGPDGWTVKLPPLSTGVWRIMPSAAARASNP